MRSWPAPPLPRLPGSGRTLRLFDTATGSLRPAAPGATARMYVCGITPYDATHLGHAATYLAFDLVQRVWRDAGRRVHYVQNVTDVDDPLLERAHQIGDDWEALAHREIELFRADMTALRVLPPDDYVGAVESIPEIAKAVRRLLDSGAAYYVDQDVYFSCRSHWPFRLRVELPARTDARVVRRARRRPGPPRQTGPARRRCCGGPSVPANRPGTPTSDRAAPDGTSSAR